MVSNSTKQIKVEDTLVTFDKPRKQQSHAQMKQIAKGMAEQFGEVKQS